MNLRELLENRHTELLRWTDDYEGIAAQGDPIPCTVTHYATVHDCINLARVKRHAPDVALLKDFLDEHWATRVNGSIDMRDFDDVLGEVTR